jgi:hypothetical protein
VKLLTDYSSVPAGTLATVDSTGTMRDGTWWFTVRWHHYRPIPQRFPRTVAEYSLNLWEPDLAMFEVVSADEQHAASRSKIETLPSETGPPWLGRRLRRKASVHSNQLNLFVADDFQY